MSFSSCKKKNSGRNNSATSHRHISSEKSFDINEQYCHHTVVTMWKWNDASQTNVAFHSVCGKWTCLLSEVENKTICVRVYREFVGYRIDRQKIPASIRQVWNWIFFLARKFWTSPYSIFSVIFYFRARCTSHFWCSIIMCVFHSWLSLYI